MIDSLISVADTHNINTNREIDIIPNLQFVENYLTEAEHNMLIEEIDKNEWSNELRRRVQHYGYKYDYKDRNINEKMRVGDLPKWALDMGYRLVADGYFDKVPDQMIINEYQPGQGIADHIDCEPCFDDTIISISLGSFTTMNFTNKNTKQKIPIILPPKSALILKGSARYDWLHGIPARKTDLINGEKTERKRRISLTFRNVLIERDKKKKAPITNNTNKELPYWLALAHVPKVKTKRKNDIVVRLFEQGKSIVDFFHAEQSSWNSEFDLTDSEIQLFKEASSELSNYAFMVEDLLEQGYHILPITSKEYSPTLKKNLGRSYAPPVIYTKGNLEILKEKSIAIVGSRKANENALTFTDTIAKKASQEYKVIVSGFAKGVDKQALDSAIKYKGQSIIVLPQGISTFKSGFKKYYKQIIKGDVLVLSVFYPKAPWSVQLAMARNPIIYGLASEIYVAESSDKGGYLVRSSRWA